MVRIFKYCQKKFQGLGVSFIKRLCFAKVHEFLNYFCEICAYFEQQKEQQKIQRQQQMVAFSKRKVSNSYSIQAGSLK